MELNVQEQEIVDILDRVDPRVMERVPFKLLAMICIDALSMDPVLANLRRVARKQPKAREESLKLYAETASSVFVDAWHDMHGKGLIDYPVPDDLLKLIG